MARKRRNARKQAEARQRYDEATSLEIISVSTAMDVINAMRAAIVSGAADLLFHEKEGAFWTNPSNTFLCTSVRALEERSVVHIAEVLKDQNRMLTLTADIRRKLDLFNHRDALSHPTVVRWNRPEMQRFHAEDRKWTDIRPALLWDFQQSLNARLREVGKKLLVETLDVTPDMVFALSGILRASLSPESRSTIPTDPELFSCLETFKVRYLDFLVEHPDGKLSRQSVA